MSRHLCLAPILVLLLVASLATTGCQKESASEPTGSSIATRQVTVDVTGMSCAEGCAPRARDALATLPWAKDVKIEFQRKQATFVADTAQYDESAIIAALEKEGFGGSIAK